MGLTEKLVYRRNHRLARTILLLVSNFEIHPGTTVAKGLTVQHRGMGTVIHPSTDIGRNVTLYHQVTIGRQDGHIPAAESLMERIVIGDHAILYPGCKILGGAGITTVGTGTIIAANAVLTQSTGDYEVWGGIPARKLGTRPPSSAARKQIVDG